MKKIAELAGVSSATVSRVLNHPELVNEKTRRRVLKIIEELGYRPNRSARSLRTRRSENVGLVIPEDSSGLFTSPYLGILIKNISEELESVGYHLVISTSRRSDLEVYDTFLKKGTVDGFIVVDVEDFDERVKHLLDIGAKFVTVGRPEGFEGVPYVDSDNLSGAYRATRYLLETGHKSIYLVNGPKRLSVCGMRLKGFEKALREFGLSAEGRVLWGRFDEESGYRLTKEILKNDSPDAIVYSGDVMAYGGMMALREEGFRIGEDVSVVGFDDIPLSRLVGLTSVRQKIEEVGRVVARMIVDLLKGREVRSKVFGTELVLRRSVRGWSSEEDGGW